jgi:AcrR family transcriptional regulator
MDAELPYRQRLEARMIDIAERVITVEGISAMQARRVAQEADCSVGTLYNVFGGLDGLVIAVNMRTLAVLGDKLQTAARGADGGSLHSQLIALALAYRDFAYQQTPRWRALFEHKMEPDKSVPPGYREAQATLFALVESALQSVIADAAQRMSAARALFSAVHGIVALALDNKLGGQDPAETERQVRLIVGALARGLATPVGKAG